MNVLETIMEVVSLNGIEQNKILQTKNYNLFKPQTSNRNGIQMPRVLVHKNNMKNGKFYFGCGFILINKKGAILDGHHRFIAMKDLNLPIVFMVTPMDLTMDEIAHLNSSINPKWNARDHFTSALNSGYDLAIKINEIIGNYHNTLKIPKSKITPSEIYGIIKGSTKYWGNGQYAPQRESYLDDDMLSVLKTDYVKELIGLFVKIKHVCHIRGERDAYKIVKVVFDLHFKGDVKFNIKKFVKNYQMLNFTHDSKMSTIRKKVYKLT